MARRTPRIDKNVASWPKAVPVKDWMQQPTVTIRADASVHEAIEVMKARRIRHLPVVEYGRLVGIVTDRDLRQMLFDPRIRERIGRDADILVTRTVRDVMTWGVITIGPQTGLRQAARLMHEQKVGALPVLETGRLVGILTERDVLRAFARLVPDGETRVTPLDAAATDNPYEYGFPEPAISGDEALASTEDPGPGAPPGR
jgi:acetoin utilization protein AcuB